LGKAQYPRVKASQGFYCSGFIHPTNKQTNLLHRYDFCLLKVELKMNNFRSNLGGAPAKKNDT